MEERVHLKLQVRDQVPLCLDFLGERIGVGCGGEAVRSRLEHLDLTAQLVDLLDECHIFLHDSKIVCSVQLHILFQLALQRVYLQ
jgi:hypothetical protein